MEILIDILVKFLKMCQARRVKNSKGENEGPFLVVNLKGQFFFFLEM